MRWSPEFQSPNMNIQNLSRRERLRVLGVQAVCAGLNNTPADAVLPEPPPVVVSDELLHIFNHDK